jgi:hypothetical protein
MDNLSWQFVVCGAIVGAAVVIIARRVLRLFAGSTAGPCGSCAATPDGTGIKHKPLVTLEPPAADASQPPVADATQQSSADATQQSSADATQQSSADAAPSARRR